MEESGAPYFGHSVLPAPAAPAPADVPHASELGRRSFEVLLVCTGNICRSQVAEALLRERVAALGSAVVVRSAGTLTGGRRADPFVVKVLRRRGIRLRGHRSTTLLPPLIEEADLVLGMASDHVGAVVAMSSEKWSRTFTLKELVRRSDSAGGRRPGETIDEWLARLHSGRVRGDLQPFLSQDDLFDPVGRSLAEYEEMVHQVDALTAKLAELLAGTQGAPTEEGVPVTDSASSVERGSDDRRSTLDEGAPPNDDHDAEETPMQAQDVNAERERDARRMESAVEAAVDGVRMARNALREAEQTATATAAQLAEALRSAAEEKPVLPADAYTQLGDEVAAVLRSAAEQSSAMRDDAERYAAQIRSKAEADALALREQSQGDAAELRRSAEDDSATVRCEADAAATALTRQAHEQAQRTVRDANDEASALSAEALAEREQAGAEAADLRRAVTTEVAALRDEADRYAKSTRLQAEADANHLRDEADRHARNVRGVAEIQSAETRDKAEHDAAGMRHAAELDARTIRMDAAEEARELVGEASARHAQLVTAEGELRSRLEGAAGALVSALEGARVLYPPLELNRSEDEAQH